MSQKIKNITTRVDGKKLKTLAEASFSAATATATAERPLTYVDKHPPPLEYKEAKDRPPLSDLAKKAREIIKPRNGPAKDKRDEYFFMQMEKNKLEWDRVRPMWEEAYEKEVTESEGFDVSYYCPGYGGIIEMELSKVQLVNKFNGPAKSAIELYNKKMDAKFKFVEVQKVNWALPRTYLMTFTASDENDEPKVFQAAFNANFNGKAPTVTLCRQKGNRLEGYRTDRYIRRSGQQQLMKRH